MKFNKDYINALLGGLCIVGILTMCCKSIEEYSLMTYAPELPAIVLDNDFTPEDQYLVALKYHNNELRFSIKGYNKESLIEVGDSAMVLISAESEYTNDCHLLYFFETDTVSDNISGKRQPINELREKIPTPPKFRMSIWPPILLILSLLTIIYLVIADQRERKRSKMDINSRLRNIHSK